MRRYLLLALSFILFAGCSKTPDYGNYSIGRDESWFPLQLAQMTPNLNGFTNALIEEIAKIEDVPLYLINIDWIQLFSSLDKQEVAGVLTPLPPNKITQQKYTFSAPFVLLGPVLILPSNSQAASLEELSGKIISVYQYDDSVLIAQKYPALIIQQYQNMATVLELLAAGEIDAVLMPALNAQALVPHLYPSQLKIASPPLNDKALRLITLKGQHTSLMSRFNKGLKKIIDTRVYSKLRKQYQINSG